MQFFDPHKNVCFLGFMSFALFPLLVALLFVRSFFVLVVLVTPCLA